jgi:hypothetical protein
MDELAPAFMNCLRLLSMDELAPGFINCLRLLSMDELGPGFYELPPSLDGGTGREDFGFSQTLSGKRQASIGRKAFG